MWRREEAASRRLKPRQALNAPYIEPVRKGRLRLDSSVHVYFANPQKRELQFRGSLALGKSDFWLLTFLSNLFTPREYIKNGANPGPFTSMLLFVATSLNFKKMRWRE